MEWQRDGTVKGLRSNGSSWIFRFRFEGKTRSMGLGLVSDLTTDEARALALHARREVKAGRDPLAEKQSRSDAGPTLGKLIDGFIKSREGSAKASTLAFYSSLRKRIEEHANRKARSLKQRDIALILDEIKGIPTRNRLLSLLRSSFAWGMERELVQSNPAQGVTRRKEPPARRYLKDFEVKRLLETLESYEKSSREGRRKIAIAVKLLLLTGQRVREVTDADLKEFQVVWAGKYTSANWTIPAKRRKTGEEQIVPLPLQVVKLIQTYLQVDRPSLDWPARDASNKGPLCKLPSYRFDWCERLFKDVGLGEPWTLRDLRRSAATKLASMGYDEALIGLILGHAPRTVTGTVYARDARLEQRREALSALHDAWMSRHDLPLPRPSTLPFDPPDWPV